MTMPDSTNSKDKAFSLAIVGGGIGGLCLAVALNSHNIQFHVYEAAAAFGEIGAGVGLGPNALRALRMLDDNGRAFQAYKNCETSNVSPEEQKRFFNFRYGMEETLPESRSPKPQKSSGNVSSHSNGSDTNGVQGSDDEPGLWTGGRLITDLRSDTTTSSVHRARFVTELVKMMPEGKSSFKKRLVTIEELEHGVKLVFDDGTEAEHDAVIGCDGIKSQTRKILLGKHNPASHPVYSGKYCYRGLVPADKARTILGDDVANDSQMYLGRGGHVMTTLIEQGKTLNVVAYHAKADGSWEDAAWVRETSREEMVSAFGGFYQPVQQILNMVEKPVMWALFDHLPAPTYQQNGRICLLGDAAHASTPHHGAGAGMAVEDAMVLSRLLSSIDSASELRAVFEAYDAVRRPRSQRLVVSSRKVAAVYDFEDEEIGNNVEAMQEYLEHAWDWIWKEDMDRHLSEARSLMTEFQRKL